MRDFLNKASKLWPLVLAVVVTAGVAVATIPDSSGEIHGCYLKDGGRLRVIDTGRGQHCKSTERPLSWNQEGPPDNSAGSAVIKRIRFSTTLGPGQGIVEVPDSWTQVADAISVLYGTIEVTHFPETCTGNIDVGASIEIYTSIEGEHLSYDSFGGHLGASNPTVRLNSGAGSQHPLYVFEPGTDTVRNITLSYSSYCLGVGEETAITIEVDVVEIR